MSAAPILAQLRPRGCNEQVIAQGWDLLRKSNGVRLLKARSSSLDRASHLAELQAAWFPVVDASLEASFPVAHERIFRNLVRGVGPDLYVSMQTLHDRVEDLFASTEPADAAASELLRSRGLTPETLGDIADAIARFQTLTAPVDPLSQEEVEKAEKDLSDFCNEWSKITRSVIKDRRLLRAMGFGRRARTKKAAATGGGAEAPQNGAAATPVNASPSNGVAHPVSNGAVTSTP